MDSSPLLMLPTELLFQILDFMSPAEYSGFSCTCRRALTVINEKLDTQEHRHRGSLSSYLSRTAGYVEYRRFMSNIRMPPASGADEWIVCYGATLEDDPDL